MKCCWSGDQQRLKMLFGQATNTAFIFGGIDIYG